MADIRKTSQNQLDLRTIKTKQGLTPEQAVSLNEELSSYGFGVQVIDLYSREVSLVGYDIKGHEMYNTVDAKEFVSNIRKVKKLKDRVEKFREKLDVDAYKTKELNELVFEKSEKITGTTGYQNYLKTLSKQLKVNPETKRNYIQEAARNTENLRKVKYQAFANPEELMKASDPNFDNKKYKNKEGKFKSKKLEKEYYKLFSELVTENYEQYENEFYGYLYDQYGDKFKEVVGSMSEQEKSKDYAEFVKARTKWIIESDGAEERYDYEVSDEELERIRGSLKKGRNRR